MPFEKAFTLFNMYFEELPIIKIINYVILETYQGGGEISKVLKRLCNDLESVKELDGLKRAYYITTNIGFICYIHYICWIINFYIRYN